MLVVFFVTLACFSCLLVVFFTASELRRSITGVFDLLFVSCFLLLLVVVSLCFGVFCCLLVVFVQRRSFVGASSEFFFVVCWLFFAVVGCFLLVLCFLLSECCFFWQRRSFVGPLSEFLQLYVFLFARPITHNHPTPHTSHGVVVMGEFLRRGTSIVPPRRLAAPPRPRHRIRGGLRDTMPAGTSAFRSVNLHHTAAPTPSERAPTTSRDPLAQNKHT